MLKLRKNSQFFRETTLFDYLAKKKEEEVAVSTIKKQVANIRRFYIKNLCLTLGIIASICLVFYVQFRTDVLQNKIDMAQFVINEYDDDLKLLSIEWYYLTRPDRLRFLSAQYLGENENIGFYQVKNYQELNQSYLANLKKQKDSEESVDVSYLEPAFKRI